MCILLTKEELEAESTILIYKKCEDWSFDFIYKNDTRGTGAMLFISPSSTIIGLKETPKEQVEDIIKKSKCMTIGDIVHNSMFCDDGDGIILTNCSNCVKKYKTENFDATYGSLEDVTAELLHSSNLLDETIEQKLKDLNESPLVKTHPVVFVKILNQNNENFITLNCKHDEEDLVIPLMHEKNKKELYNYDQIIISDIFNCSEELHKAFELDDIVDFSFLQTKRDMLYEITPDQSGLSFQERRKAYIIKAINGMSNGTNGTTKLFLKNSGVDHKESNIISYGVNGLNVSILHIYNEKHNLNIVA